MSVQKYKKSGSCKSDSIYSFSQDVNLLQDYEYLLQKSAEEITKVKEQNQILEQQLASVQPFNNNQYSTFQLNKNDFVIEQLKQENAELKLKIETKNKANKKLKNKCKQFEQILQENENLKKDLQDMLREKINTKENKQLNSNMQGKGQFQLQPCNQLKADYLSSSSLNFKALEEAEKFLQDTKIQSSRVMKCQPILTPKSQPPEFQPLVINFSDEHLQQNLAQQEELVGFLSQISEKATTYLNEKIQNNQIKIFSEAYEDLEKQIFELTEQNWFLLEKNKIQSEQIKQLKSLIDSIDLKNIKEIINFYKNYNQEYSSYEEIDDIQQKFNETNKYLDENCKIVQDSFNVLYKQKIQTSQIDEFSDENKENQCMNQCKKNNKFSQIQITDHIKPQKKQNPQYTQSFIDPEEFNQLKESYQLLFKQIEDLSQSIDQYENVDQNQISKQELFEILELFSEEISYRENASIKEQIIYQVKQMQEENECLKNRYLDLIYKVILNQIKTDQRRTELFIKNDPKLQEAMQWLLKSSKKAFKIQTIFNHCDTLVEMIIRKHNFASRMSELHEIISMQMKVGRSNLNSSRTTQKSENSQQNLMNEAIEDLKELNKKISNLPETSLDDESQDLKSNILQMCTKLK